MHQDWRVYSQRTKNSNFELETNTPEDLNKLISKLKTQDQEAEEELKRKEEEKQKITNGRRKTRQSAQNLNKSSNLLPEKPKNADLIIGKHLKSNIHAELESLIPVFAENQEEYNKRQIILARKMQTLERSRMLITRQRTRRAETEVESSLLSGRMTRSRMKDINKPKQIDNNEQEGTKQSYSVF